MISFLSDLKLYLPQLFLKALTVALPLTVISFIIGLILATVSAIIFTLPKANKILNFLKSFLNFYVWFFRSTPLLVQLYIAFFGLKGIFANAWIAGIIVLSLNIGAYVSQNIKGAILSVSKNQFESAIATGLTVSQSYKYVILPLALPAAIPALGNSFISLFKDTSLISAITIIDPFLYAQQISGQNFHTLNLYLLTAIMYAFFSTIFAYLQSVTEKHFSIIH
ncbi:MAG: amino acid ABC transporter permease [Lactobacillaceae bacterium]|jgi:cystine transport system permease protein|nr:amino acid ABC transporter permease [Lactobacillaceae bacterium]